MRKLSHLWNTFIPWNWISLSAAASVRVERGKISTYDFIRILIMTGFFFFFLLKWDPFKKYYIFRQIVPIRHDFICTNRLNKTRLCHVILKSCQLGTTSATSFLKKSLLFIYWVVSYVMLKINLIHNFLRVLVLRKKKLNNRVCIMFG